MADADEGPAVLAHVTAFPAPQGPIDLEVRSGDVVLLRGPNGSGKTSLLRQLAGLDAPMRATAVRLLGDDPSTLAATRLAQRVRAVWAQPRASLVGLTLRGEARLRSCPVPDDLGPLADRDVARLSAGEARRAALAFAAASPAPLLVLDEPCPSLDADGLARLEALVRAAARAGAVVAADHTGHLGPLATRVVDLAPGQADPWPAMPTPASGPVLRATAAHVRLDGTRVDLPGAAWPAGLHGVAGRNGAGKTTLLRRLAGLLDPDGVAIDGQPPRPGRNVTLQQADAGDLLQAETVAGELSGCDDAEGLVPDSLAGRHPLSLSSGEAQRVALAKALGRGLPVHLLDEPEAHLDADGRRRLAAAIARRAAAGACVLTATHDAALLGAAQTRTVLA